MNKEHNSRILVISCRGNSVPGEKSVGPSSKKEIKQSTFSLQFDHVIVKKYSGVGYYLAHRSNATLILLSTLMASFSPMQRGMGMPNNTAWRVEHALRHPAPTKHYRSPANELPWHHFHQLHIFSFMLAFIILLIMVFAVCRVKSPDISTMQFAY